LFDSVLENVYWGKSSSSTVDYELKPNFAPTEIKHIIATPIHRTLVQYHFDWRKMMCRHQFCVGSALKLQRGSSRFVISSALAGVAGLKDPSGWVVGKFWTYQQSCALLTLNMGDCALSDRKMPFNQSPGS